jgi:separase
MRVVLVDVKKLAQHDAERTDEDDDHLFLVLDRNLQGFPLESTPILRGRSVSRIPSVSFLIDRLELARISANHPPLPEGAAYKMGGMPVDPSRVFYLLNPEGDLKHTEEAFSPWLQSMKKVGWNGIIGRRPTEFELTGALDRHDLFM